jgi:hypothetical protein
MTMLSPLIDLEMSYARYLRARGRAHEANEIARRRVLERRGDDADAYVRLIGGSFPHLEDLCRQFAGKTAYSAARALGAALGELRWLPPLVPILEAQPFEAASGAIHSAIAAMMCKAEPRDADRIRDTLLPAARALRTDRSEQAWIWKAARFRRAALAEIAAAFAACKETEAARTIVDALRAELDGLGVVDRACAHAVIAPPLVLLGERVAADELIASAEAALDHAYDDDVDGYGDVWFDWVAQGRAEVTHFATWEHGKSWIAEAPVAHRYVNYSYFGNRGGPRGAEHEALENKVAFHVEASKTVTRFANGQLAAALDVIDRARETDADYVPELIKLICASADEIDKECLPRLAEALRAMPDDAIATCVMGLARLRHTELALQHVRRIPNERQRTEALVEIACALGAREATRAQAPAIAEEVVALEARHPEAAAVARRLLEDLAHPPPHVPEIIWEDSYEHDVEAHLMHLVLLFGNGLEGDTRFTANTHDAVLTARGLIMGTGSCRRVPDMPEHPLYKPGDECYRQGSYAYAFLCPTPVAR